MRPLSIGLLGAVFGIGVLLIIAGARGRTILGTTLASVAPTGRATKASRVFDRLLLRVVSALGGAFVGWFSTGWPVAAALAAIAAWTAPTAWRARGRHADEVAKVEAIASWAEQVRDTLGAANGLEHAITASSRLAPDAIRPAVERLAARMGYESFSTSLRGFADDLDHPLGDFVTAALVTAAEKQARDVAQLLGHLAECARDEAKMRTRVWVGRARTRTASRVMVGTILGFLAFMILTNPAYLEPYGTAGGQLVLAIIGAVFAGAFVAMDRMGRIALPERFIGRRVTGANSTSVSVGAIGALR